MDDTHAITVEDVRGSGIYPATGPHPDGKPVLRTAGQLGHPEEWHKTFVTAQTIETAALLAGRAIYGGYFVYNGINHLVNRRMMADYARSKGVRAADAAVVTSGLMIIAGGTSLVLGVKPKVGVGLISGFLLVVSPQIHAFWKERDPQRRMQEMVNFTKNLALVGASLFAAALPEPWRWQPRRRQSTEALMALR